MWNKQWQVYVSSTLITLLNFSQLQFNFFSPGYEGWATTTDHDAVQAFHSDLILPARCSSHIRVL